jgi:hypothetical protein
LLTRAGQELVTRRPDFAWFCRYSVIILVIFHQPSPITEQQQEQEQEQQQYDDDDDDDEQHEIAITSSVETAAAVLTKEEGGAGSWYSSDRATSFLEVAENESSSNSSQVPPLRAVICTHAGYSYSGPTAAFSYYHLQQELKKPNSPIIQHILVLHLSHHFYLNGCAVSGVTYLETPLGDLQVDDFCHWGSRFQYQPTPTTTSMEIHQHIRGLHRKISVHDRRTEVVSGHSACGYYVECHTYW